MHIKHYKIVIEDLNWHCDERKATIKMAITKYRFKFLFVLDSICYVMTYPWLAMLSLFCSCFWTTTEEGKNPSRKFVHYIVYAPILGLIEIVTFPLAVFGYFFWILICNGKYLTANIFESGPMPTPWKFLNRPPLLPSCKLG